MAISGPGMSVIRRLISVRRSACWAMRPSSTFGQACRPPCPGTRVSCVEDGRRPVRFLKSRYSGLHSDHRRIFSGAFRVAVFLLLGKVAGALKEMSVAYRYGVSEVVDAYQFTMTLANWLPITIVGALSVVLIPVLVRSRDDDPDRRRRFLAELHGWVLGVGLILAVATYVAWPWVLTVAGAGLDAETRRMSEQLTLAFAPAALLTLMTGLSAARLRARERYINTLMDSVPAVVILVWVMLAFTAPDVGPLLWGTLVGYL